MLCRGPEEAKGAALTRFGVTAPTLASSSRTSRYRPTAWEFWSSFLVDMPILKGPAGAVRGICDHRQRRARSSLAARRRRRRGARRERQHGAALDRRRAHRRPPQPGRPPPVPRRRRPRPPAVRRGRRHRAPRRLRGAAATDPGPALRPAGRAGPHVAARRRPARSAGESGARAVRPHGRAALRRVPRRRRALAARRLRGGRRAGHGAPGSRVGHARVGARGGRPRGRPRHLRARDRRQAHAPRAAGHAAARLPLARLGADGAARRARRRHRAQRRRRPRLLAPRGRARGSGADLRRSHGHPAHHAGARAPRQDRARAGRPLPGGGADARLRAVRPELRAAAAHRRQRRLRGRLAGERRRDPPGRQLHQGRRGHRACATRSSTPPGTRRWSAPCSTTRRSRSTTCATSVSARTSGN